MSEDALKHVLHLPWLALAHDLNVRLGADLACVLHHCDLSLALDGAGCNHHRVQHLRVHLEFVH